MDYANMFRTGGQPPGYIMPQYGAAAQPVQQQHGQQRYQLHQHQQQQNPYHIQLQLHHQQHSQVQHRQLSQPQPTQGFTFPYTNDQLLVLAQMQQQRTMLNQAQVAAHAPPQTKQEQPKPRLSKDEVDLLEKEFQKNQKPSSGRKREIAEILKVDQPRINNWFQNRRAKEKGIKKTQEFAARQAAEQSELSENGSTRSPDTDAEGVGSEYFGLETQEQHSGRPSSAPFPEPRQEPEPADDTPAADESSYASPAGHSIHQSIEQNDFCGSNVKEEYPSPESLPFQSSEATSDVQFAPQASAFAPELDGQSEYQDGFLGHGAGVLPQQMMQDSLSIPGFMPSQTQDQPPFSHHQFTSTTGPDSILAPTPSFPSQLVVPLEMHELEEDGQGDAQQSQSSFDMDNEQAPATTFQDVSDGCMSLTTEQQNSSPDSNPASPPTPDDLRFKSPPPPSNIASRRNKGVPAQLNATALRAYSYGPRTGLDLSKRPDVVSPGMRRIASASGSAMPGRIQKSLASASIGGASGTPRSPLARERTKDALMRSLQSTVAAARSPVMGGSAVGNVISPMTPSGGDYFGGGGLSVATSTQGTREATAASSASDDEQHYGLGAAPSAVAGSFFTGTLKTPPGTPGINGAGTGGYSEHQMLPAQMNTFEAAWNFNPQDEPLVTPGLGSFGSEEFAMASSAPGYIGSSQPPTPSFPHSLGPSSFTSYPWSTAGPSVVPYSSNGAGMAHGGNGMTEYAFPETFIPDSSAMSSPGLPKASKQFQFTQNVTPQDYSDK